MSTRFDVTFEDRPDLGGLATLTARSGEGGRRPATLSVEALRSLDAALDEVDERDDVVGLLVTGEGAAFIAGADLDAFPGAEPGFAREVSQLGHRTFARLAALPYPTLAAINGACVGGGLELALHCDHRVVAADVRNVSFPEVFLNIVPAWGGTQLAPRLVGGPDAIATIVSDALNGNRPMDAERALARGFADRLLPADGFVGASRDLLEAIVAGREELDRAAVDPVEGLSEALEQARAAVEARVHGATPAPGVALDLLEFAALGGDLQEGYAREEQALADLLPGRHAQASVYAYDLTQRRVRRQPWRPDTPPRDVSKVAVIGAGLMGAQIGTLFLHRLQVPVVLKDIDEDVLGRAREHVEGALDRRVQAGKLGEEDAARLKDQVTYTLEYDDVSGADWVVEAVLEDLELKRRIVADVEQVVAGDAVIASNTSSLSIGAMARDLERPERVIGFHFFNPIEVLPLVEVVRPDGASDVAVATAFEVATRLRKSAVQAADTPAFILNRLLIRFFGRPAWQAVRSGVPFRDVDRAYEQLGLPMGPMVLFGFVGLQVAYHTARTLHEAYPERFPVDDNFARVADLDVDGIYDPGTGAVRDEVLEAVEVEPEAQPWSGERIRERALEEIADEIGVMLDTGVVADARDIDTCLLLGANFPFFLGGLAKHLDQIGVSERVVGHQLVGERDRAG